MTENEVKQGILAFIRSEIAYPGIEITEETDLFDDGVLDSLALLKLVLHLEATYEITFDPEDLNAAAFARVPSLSTMILGRIEARP